MSILSKPIRVGRYLLCDKIAAGGMASVYFGRLEGPSGFSKTVAIKRLHPQLVRMPDFRNMILEEGRLAARIRHPNVVPPLDVLSEAGELLLVMEYVHGESLSKLMKGAWAQNERVPLAVAAAITANMFHGLHAAHEARDEAGVPLDIVHRDISPQNVIVGVDGIARVIDFGIAKAVTSAESTSQGTVKGKVPYLAPEQLEGEITTRRTDLYAAAVVFWESLAGKRLFEGQDDAEILQRIVQMTIPPPSSLNPAVPRAVDDIILRGLARKPSDRYATAREMALALETCVPLATTTQVGAWTERLAAQALRERANKLAQVEKLSIDAPTENLAARARDFSPVTGGGSPLVSPSGAIKGVSFRVAPGVSLTPADVSRSLSLNVGTMEGPAVQEAVPTMTAELPPSSRGSRATPNQPILLPAAGALRKPALEMSNVAWIPPTPIAEAPTTSVGKRIVFSIIAAIVFFAIVGVLFSPYIVQRAVVSRAQELGIKLYVDRVEVSRRQLRFIDVHAESHEVPGLTVHSSAVVVNLRGFSPVSIIAEDSQIGADGNWQTVVGHIARWRTTHTTQLRDATTGLEQIAISSAKIEWANVGGVETKLMIENASFDMQKLGTRAFGDDWKAESPIVRISSGKLGAGPWRLDLDRTGILTRAVLRFDPSGTYPSSITWTSAEDGSVGTVFAVQPTPLAELHVPKELLGSLATEKTRLEIRGEVNVVTSQQVGAAAKISKTASGKLTLGGVNMVMLPGAPPVDTTLELKIEGDASLPIALNGALMTIAPAEPSGPPSFKALLTGKLDLTGNAARIELGGRTNAAPCIKGGDVAYAAQVTLALDRIQQTKVALDPTKACIPKLR